MCGRYTLQNSGAELWEEFSLDGEPETLPLRFNIAPTQDVAVVGRRPGKPPKLGSLRWGLVPSWAKELAIGNKMINARSETLAEKPSFRDAFRKRRCLVVADGFYEWKKLEGGEKQPMYIRRPDGRPFGFAGLWERWRSPASGAVYTCTIITGPSEGAIESIHHRMPLIIRPDDRATWLDPELQDVDALRPLFERGVDERLVPVAVSKRVNSVANDGPENIVPC